LALRQAIQTLWQNPAMAAEMGRKAEQRYWELFTADKMVDSYVDLYRDLVSNEKR
jgi:rhamnosyl/mannosyltransferase